MWRKSSYSYLQIIKIVLFISIINNFDFRFTKNNYITVSQFVEFGCNINIYYHIGTYRSETINCNVQYV